MATKFNTKGDFLSSWEKQKKRDFTGQKISNTNDPYAKLDFYLKTNYSRTAEDIDTVAEFLGVDRSALTKATATPLIQGFLQRVGLDTDEGWNAYLASPWKNKPSPSSGTTPASRARAAENIQKGETVQEQIEKKLITESQAAITFREQLATESGKTVTLADGSVLTGKAAENYGKEATTPIVPLGTSPETATREGLVQSLQQLSSSLSGLDPAMEVPESIAQQFETIKQGIEQIAPLPVSIPGKVTPPLAPPPVPTTPLQSEIATRAGVTIPTPSSYMGTSVVDYLKSVGQASDINSRIALGKQYGVDYGKSTTDYAAENTALLNALRSSGGGGPSVATPPATSTAPAGVPAPAPAPLSDSVANQQRLLGLQQQLAEKQSHLEKGIAAGYGEGGQFAGQDIPESVLGGATPLMASPGQAALQEEINQRATGAVGGVGGITAPETAKDQLVNKLVDALAASQPGRGSLEAEYTALKKSAGVTAGEETVQDFNTEIGKARELLTTFDSQIRRGMNVEEARLAPMELITGRQAELGRQAGETRQDLLGLLDTLSVSKGLALEDLSRKDKDVATRLGLREADLKKPIEDLQTELTLRSNIQNVIEDQFPAVIQSSYNDQGDLTIVVQDPSTGQFSTRVIRGIGKVTKTTGSSSGGSSSGGGGEEREI